MYQLSGGGKGGLPGNKNTLCKVTQAQMTSCDYIHAEVAVAAHL